MGLARKICFQRPCAMKPQSGASSSNSLWPRGHNKQHFCFFFFSWKCGAMALDCEQASVYRLINPRASLVLTINNNNNILLLSKALFQTYLKDSNPLLKNIQTRINFARFSCGDQVLSNNLNSLLKYGSQLIVSFLHKCSTLLSLILCRKNRKWSKNIKLTKNLWCFVPGTV